MNIGCWFSGHDLIRVVKTTRRKTKLFHECQKCDHSVEVLPGQKLKVVKSKNQGKKIAFPQKKVG